MAQNSILLVYHNDTIITIIISMTALSTFEWISLKKFHIIHKLWFQKDEWTCLWEHTTSL